MSKLIGTGTLKKYGQKQKVHVCLNLDDNVIEIYQYISSMEDDLKTRFLLLIDLNSQDFALTDVRLISPMGIIRTDSLPDCFIYTLKPGEYRDIKSEILKVMNEYDFAMTKIILKPYCSKIQFNFDPFAPDHLEDRYYEIIYDGTKNMSDIKNINIHLDSNQKLVVYGDNGHFVVKSHTPFLDYEEIIRISLGILLGGPISIRYIYDGELKTITINLAAHEGKAIGPLYRNSNGEELLNKIFKYLFQAMLDENKWEKLKRGLYYYLQGLGGIAPIEIRTINLFTFLEIIDESKTLDKNKISKLLDITIDEASILCETRSSLIHKGLNIPSALINAKNKIESKKGSTLENSLFLINPEYKHNMTVCFYLTLAMLLNKYLIKEIGYSGQWNDYSEYLSVENKRCDNH